MDELDVRRIANKAAEELARSTGIGIAVARRIAKDAIVGRYRIAVEYEGVPAGMQAAWLSGWQKGYGR